MYVQTQEKVSLSQHLMSPNCSVAAFRAWATFGSAQGPFLALWLLRSDPGNPQGTIFKPGDSCWSQEDSRQVLYLFTIRWAYHTIKKSTYCKLLIC